MFEVERRLNDRWVIDINLYVSFGHRLRTSADRTSPGSRSPLRIDLLHLSSSGRTLYLTCSPEPIGQPLGCGFDIQARRIHQQGRRACHHHCPFNHSVRVDRPLSSATTRTPSPRRRPDLISMEDSDGSSSSVSHMPFVDLVPLHTIARTEATTMTISRQALSCSLFKDSGYFTPGGSYKLIWRKRTWRARSCSA
jgi:hypothetical protein